MTAPKARAHLVERAVEALGGPGALDLLRPSPRPAGAPPGTAAAEPGAAAAAAPRRAAAGAPAVPPPPTTEPVIGMDALTGAGLAGLPNGAGRSRMLEELAVVQHQILRTVRETQPSADGRCNRVVLITSARPGEGKTFTALNIAVGIAAGEAEPVVLVDADGKHGSLGALLGCADRPGLRVLAADPAQRPRSFLVPSAIQGLSLLPYGIAPPEQPAVASAASVASAVLRLAAALPDHILILDTPPCLSTGDPSILAAIAGQVVMVVEAMRTQQNEVEAALDMVEACPTLQLLLNRTRYAARDTFGAYGSYVAGSAAHGGRPGR